MVALAIATARTSDTDPIWMQLIECPHRKVPSLQEVYLPKQSLLKSLKDLTLPEQKTVIKAKRKVFQQVMQGDVDDMVWGEVLDVLDTFYVLTKLPQRWSDLVQHKCSCPESFKWGICQHCILLAFISDRNLKIPDQYCKRTIEQRSRRGRPGKDQGLLGDMEERQCRNIERLSKEYRGPSGPLAASRIEFSDDDDFMPVSGRGGGSQVSTGGSQRVCEIGLCMGYLVL